MKQILVIAFLILCITAKKHHKQEQEATDPMTQCLQENCMNEAFECVFDDQCAETISKCDEQLGDSSSLDKRLECIADNELASTFANCMKTHCVSFQQVMKLFNRRK